MYFVCMTRYPDYIHYQHSFALRRPGQPTNSRAPLDFRFEVVELGRKLLLTLEMTKDEEKAALPRTR